MEVHCVPDHECACEKKTHDCKKIVLTGGPGAGKTAILEIAKKNFCQHIAVLPEAASVIFSGGFWRHDSLPAKMSAQRAIFHIQKEIERLVVDEKQSAIALCDRGILDGLAYWPSDEASFWKEVGSTIKLGTKNSNK
jgi:predicted ATPase